MLATATSTKILALYNYMGLILESARYRRIRLRVAKAIPSRKCFPTGSTLGILTSVTI